MARADTPMAMVNGQAISRETIELLGSAYLAQLRQKYGRRFTQDMERQALREVLDQVVTATVLVQEAERRGIVASEAEVDTQVAMNEFFRQADGTVDWAKFSRYKADPNSNYAQIATSLRRLVLADKLTLSRKAELAASFPEDTLRAAFRRYETTRIGDLIVIRPDTIVTDRPPDNEEIGRTYMRRRESFRTTALGLSAVVLRRSEFASGVDISSADLASYYRAHAAEFASDTTGTPRPFAEVRDEIRARLVRERTSDAARGAARRVADGLRRGSSPSAASGGKGEVHTLDVLVGLSKPDPLFPDSVIASAASAEQGAVLGPVELVVGPVVYRVESRKASFVPEMAAIRDTVVGEIRRQRGQERERRVEEYYHRTQARWMSGERFNLGYVIVRQLPSDPKPAVSPGAVREFYLSHRDRYRSEEQVRAAHILIPVAATAGPAAEAAARQRVDSLQAAIAAGADFGELAKAFSADPGSARAGGDLGYFGRGRMVEPFEKAAFGLPVSKVSDPVRSEFGWHLIRVLDHRPGRTKPLEEVKGEIEGELRTQKLDSVLKARATDLLRRAVAARSLAPVAAAYGGVRETGPFGLGDPLPVVGKQVEIDRQIATLRKGDFAPGPVRVAGGFLIYRVLQRLAPEPLPYAQVHEQVSHEMFRADQQAAAHERAVALRDRVRAGSNFFTLAGGYGEIRHATWKAGEDIVGIGPPTPAQADTLNALPEGGVTTLELTFGVAVVNVTKIQAPGESYFQAKKEEVRRKLADERYGTWVASLRDKASVHYFAASPK